MASLRPQDIAVVLNLCRHVSDKAPTFSSMASELSMSASEVHAAVQRARASRLLHGSTLGGRPNLGAIEEFLVHGLKYAFPAERGEPTRGVPTSYAAEPLRKVIALGDEPPLVWPYAIGSQRGTSFKP